jgi:hypothetical protein
MANEISISAALTASKNGVTVSSGSQAINVTMTGSDMIAQTQNIGTAAELINKGDVTTIGCLFIKNLDPTNYVELALEVGMTNKVARLDPGGIALYKPVSGTTIYARANTAACDCLVVIAEE